MISLTPDIQSLIEQLLRIMDEEIALLDVRRRQMGLLAEAILDSDDDAMEKLLSQIEHAQQQQSAVDLRLSAIRNTIALALKMATDQMRLSWLIKQLPPQEAVEIEYRRQQIILLVSKFRRQHMTTAILLVESARINRMMLESIFPQGETVETYDAGGVRPWRRSAGLVDTEL